MIDTILIRRFLGFTLIFAGLFFMILDRYSCKFIGNIPNNEEFILCIKLFTFVGIVLVVCGSSMLIRANMPPEY